MREKKYLGSLSRGASGAIVATNAPTEWKKVIFGVKLCVKRLVRLYC